MAGGRIPLPRDYCIPRGLERSGLAKHPDVIIPAGRMPWPSSLSPLLDQDCALCNPIPHRCEESRLSVKIAVVVQSPGRDQSHKLIVAGSIPAPATTDPPLLQPSSRHSVPSLPSGEYQAGIDAA